METFNDPTLAIHLTSLSGSLEKSYRIICHDTEIFAHFFWYISCFNSLSTFFLLHFLHKCLIEIFSQICFPTFCEYPIPEFQSGFCIGHRILSELRFESGFGSRNEGKNHSNRFRHLFVPCLFRKRFVGYELGNINCNISCDFESSEKFSIGCSLDKYFRSRESGSGNS